MLGPFLAEGAKELEVVVVEEDFKEEDEDIGIGFAKTTGLIATEEFGRLFLRSVVRDDACRVPDLTMCGRLDVGIGGGASERGGVVMPAGEGSSEVDEILLTAFGLGRFCGWEVVIG